MIKKFLVRAIMPRSKGRSKGSYEIETLLPSPMKYCKWGLINLKLCQKDFHVARADFALS